MYGTQISTSHVRMVGGQMIQMLLKLGLVETATSLVAGIFKSSLVGYAAGGAVQGVSMAYLTHVSGEAFAEYFKSGQTWGDGGMQAALIRQFDLTEPRRVPPRFRQAGGDESVQPPLACCDQDTRTAQRQAWIASEIRATFMSQLLGEFPRLFPKPMHTIGGIGRRPARR